MSANHRQRRTSKTLIVTLAIIAVILIVVPAGVYAGIVLSALVLSTVLISEALRRDPRMIAVSVLALVATVGALIASRTLGS